MKLEIESDMNIVKHLATQFNETNNVDKQYAILSTITNILDEVSASIRDVPMKTYHDMVVNNTLRQIDITKT